MTPRFYNILKGVLIGIFPYVIGFSLWDHPVKSIIICAILLVITDNQGE